MQDQVFLEREKYRGEIHGYCDRPVAHQSFNVGKGMKKPGEKGDNCRAEGFYMGMNIGAIKDRHREYYLIKVCRSCERVPLG